MAKEYRVGILVRDGLPGFIDRINGSSRDGTKLTRASSSAVSIIPRTETGADMLSDGWECDTRPRISNAIHGISHVPDQAREIQYLACLARTRFIKFCLTRKLGHRPTWGKGVEQVLRAPCSWLSSGHDLGIREGVSGTSSQSCYLTDIERQAAESSEHMVAAWGAATSGRR